MRRLIWLMLFLSPASLISQVAGAGGRSTFTGGNGITFAPGIHTITCAGSTCTSTSSTVSPSSTVVTSSVVLSFTATHDASYTIGGPAGAGVGLMQVSCDGGTTWNSIVYGSATIGGTTSVTYPGVGCSGVSNLNTLLFRSYLGGGGPSSITMTFGASSGVSITW